MLQPSAHCKALIAGSENCARALPDGRFHAYPDPGTGGAPWTIGFGATGPDIGPNTIWTLAQCEARFDRDIGRFAAGVRQLVGAHPTTQNQFDALVSFAFNCGLDIDADTIAEGLGDSTLLKLHNSGQYGTFDPKTGKGTGAAGEFAKWNKSGRDHKVLPGLTTRRAKEAALYATP